MGRTAALVVLVALLGSGGTAAAATLEPTAPELAWAQSKAVAYWHVSQPPCGSVQVFNLPLIASAATALPDSCVITFSTAVDWRDFPSYLCRVYVHEFGHLVLGADYFAASNPADPAHSADPLSVMYADPTWQQADAEGRAVGCLAARQVKHLHKHHRRTSARTENARAPR